MTFGELRDLAYENYYKGIQTIFLGDIIDLKNAKKSEVGKAKDAIRDLSIICHQTNSVYIGGNHELNYGNLPINALINNTYYTHGHLLTNLDKYSKWNIEIKEAGAGFFKRHFITPTIDKLRHLLAVRPNEELLGNIKRIANSYSEVKEFYMGHSHPSKDVVFHHAGIKCTILSRGIHYT
jgi:hypothetical protein